MRSCTSFTKAAIQLTMLEVLSPQQGFELS